MTQIDRQILELERLLDAVGDNPIARPQISRRLDLAKKQRSDIASPPASGELFPDEPERLRLARTAIFFRRGGVQGSEGIRASLAGEAMVQYEKMFIAQAIHEERLQANDEGRQRRQKGAKAPELLFTATPRGSFGLEFTPRTSDAAIHAVHGESLNRLTESIAKTVDSSTFNDAVEDIPSSVLKPLKQFLKTVASYKAELRLVSPRGESIIASAEDVSSASERLEREIVQEVVKVEGTNRGLARDSGHFDLRPADGTAVIMATLSDELTEDDLDMIARLKECVAQFEMTTISSPGASPSVKYVLLGASRAADE